ncbi:hypothetical protein SPBRAN_867 [uncultured Candidatus Thioglobus sp.]|nr:hypothetical protein SPBRAN_867 [uncultured Candidatus Thioglobus sp.]
MAMKKPSFSVITMTYLIQIATTQKMLQLHVVVSSKSVPAHVLIIY